MSHQNHGTAMSDAKFADNEIFSRNIGAISPAQQRLLQEGRVAVIGCGGLGGHVIEMLVRLGVGSVHCFDPPRLHHYSAPNRSRLGVFISASRKPRGVPGRSACADGRRTRGRDAPGSPLFRPLFSRNLRQLLRRGTRTRPCAPETCAHAIAIGCPANVEQQSITPRCPK